MNGLVERVMFIILIGVSVSLIKYILYKMR